jgi:hypothetical protein
MYIWNIKCLIVNIDEGVDVELVELVEGVAVAGTEGVELLGWRGGLGCRTLIAKHCNYLARHKAPS